MYDSKQEAEDKCHYLNGGSKPIKSIDNSTISLRDHFAGLAMQALITKGNVAHHLIPFQSFRFADTMLKEREVGK